MTQLHKIKYILGILLLLLDPVLSFAANASIIDNIQDITNNPSLTGRLIQLFLLISVIALAPALLIMLTSFMRIIIVFSILRSALGLQQTPANQILIALSLFLTFFIMSPALEKSYETGLKPLISSSISEEEAIPMMIAPFEEFMSHNTRYKDISLFSSIANVNLNDDSRAPLRVLVPSFMISELRKSFEFGFLIFLPFLIIDIVVASILMAMGMMMMPPVMISLPFKIIFFVLIDGWYLLSGSLVRSFYM